MHPGHPQRPRYGFLPVHLRLSSKLLFNIRYVLHREGATSPSTVHTKVFTPVTPRVSQFNWPSELTLPIEERLQVQCGRQKKSMLFSLHDRTFIPCAHFLLHSERADGGMELIHLWFTPESDWTVWDDLIWTVFLQVRNGSPDPWPFRKVSSWRT